MVATPSLARELEARGFERRAAVDARRRYRAVPAAARCACSARGPVFLYVGRIAVEKNIEAFLDLDLPGRKVVVGDGPQLAGAARPLSRRAVHRQEDRRGARPVLRLRRRVRVPEPHRHLRPGAARGHGLRRLPVAAFPVTGPIDVVKPGETGVLSEDLRQAALAALTLDRARVRARATEFSWENAARLFLANITSACLKEPARAPARAKALRILSLPRKLSQTPRRS